jgi:hypothetical protein
VGIEFDTFEWMSNTKLTVAFFSCCFTKGPKNNIYGALALFQANSGSAIQESPHVFIESQDSLQHTQKPAFLIKPLYTISGI